MNVLGEPFVLCYALPNLYCGLQGSAIGCLGTVICRRPSFINAVQMAGEAGEYLLEKDQACLDL